MKIIQIVGNQTVLEFSQYERSIMASVSLELFRGAFRLPTDGWALAGLRENQLEQVFMKFEQFWRESKTSLERKNITLSLAETSRLKTFASKFPDTDLRIPEKRWAAVPMPCSYSEACSFFVGISSSLDG